MMIKEEMEDFKNFFESMKRVIIGYAAVILAVYGIRIIHENIYVDSRRCAGLWSLGVERKKSKVSVCGDGYGGTKTDTCGFHLY